MKTYSVTIQATITKTVVVEADDETDAIEQAHEEFSIECDGGPEDYNQETVSVKEDEEAESVEAQ